MPFGSLCLTDSTLNALLRGSLPSLETDAITAVLLSPAYVPALEQHTDFSDIQDFEVTAGDAKRLQLKGTTVTGLHFQSDDLIFGDPVTLGPVRYVAFVFGSPAILGAASRLLGIADLSPAGGALEAQRSQFSIGAPAGGWFSLARAVSP